MSSVIWGVPGSKKVTAPGRHQVKEAQDPLASPVAPFLAPQRVGFWEPCSEPHVGGKSHCLYED